MLRKALAVLVAFGALTLATPALAQTDDAPVQPTEPAPNLTPPPPGEIPAPDPQAIPADQAPDEGEPPPQAYEGPAEDDGYAQPAPPPQVQVRVAAPAPSVQGQWVYTRQYGWVWMPYGQSYTYVVPGGSPYMFVYSMGFGWRWVTAPWVYGWGPHPYWGVRGLHSFYWHRHPWFRVPRYRGPIYRGPMYRPGYRVHYRTGYRNGYRTGYRSGAHNGGTRWNGRGSSYSPPAHRGSWSGFGHATPHGTGNYHPAGPPPGHMVHGGHGGHGGHRR